MRSSVSLENFFLNVFSKWEMIWIQTTEMEDAIDLLPESLLNGTALMHYLINTFINSFFPKIERRM